MLLPRAKLSLPAASKPKPIQALAKPPPEASPAVKPLDADAALRLPHERDEAVGEVAPQPDPVMVRAKRDIDAGLVDTDMRATPGLDAARREQLVPGPGGKPPGKG
jgi:hypothetical protein